MKSAATTGPQYGGTRPDPAAGGYKGAGYRRFVSHNGIAVLALLAAMALTGLGGVAYFFANQNDDSREANQAAQLRATTENFRTGFADFTHSRAHELAAAGPLGQLTSLRLGDRSTAVRSAHLRADRTLLIDADGTLSGLDALDAKDKAVPAAIRRVAAEFLAEAIGQTQTASASKLQAIASPVVADYVVLDGRLAIASIALIDDAPGASGSVPPALVAVTELGRSQVEQFTLASGIDGLIVAAAPGQGNNVQALLDRRGRIVGWSSWPAQRPMTNAVVRGSPFLGFAILSLFGAAGIAANMGRRAKRTTEDDAAKSLKIADQDATTGLAHRHKVLGFLNTALEALRPEEVLAIGFIDLDNFKDVNDALGYEGGDDLLAAIGWRLKGAAPEGCMIGRIGSDEFAFVLKSDNSDDPVRIAKLLADVMTRPFWTKGQVVQITASVGVAQAPRDGENADDLIRRADYALRAAQKLGRSRVVRFAPEMEEQLKDRNFIKKELRRALGDGVLEVHYQPIVGAAHPSRLVGVEALLRWEHPTRGSIPPNSFVPIAEQSGLMDALGEFVLRKALADAMRWPNLYVAINVSPVQVADRGFIDLVAAVLEETKIEPSRVILEVTEGVLIDDPVETQKRLEKLRQLGIRIALDDYGIGYSSLKYLQRFPFDKLKIDKEFVAPLGRSANGAVIIHSIVGLGRALGLSVLAEGVEREDQRVLLRLAGCDEMQGFLFGYASPRETIDALVAGSEVQAKAQPARQANLAHLG